MAGRRVAALLVLTLLAAALPAPALAGTLFDRSHSPPGLDRALAARLAEGIREPTIVGGSPADPGEYPWMVYMEIAFPDGPDPGTELDIFQCGGSLIGERWVLTAAHCFFDEAGNPTAIGAATAIGVTNLNNIPDKTIYPADLVIGFGFNPVTGDNDLALLRIARPAPDQGIVLVRPGDEDLWPPGQLATIAGWGTTSEEGDVSDILLEAQVPIVDDATCGSLLPGLFNPATMLCAGFPQGGVDACFGDSGGPLMVPAGRGRFVEAGIVTAGIGCARPNLPGVYTRVAAYTEQIVATLKAEPEAAVGDPTARTGRATNVRRTSARVSGTVNANGLAAHALIELGRTKRYGRVVESYVGSGHGDLAIDAVFTRLKRNTVYHFRVGVSTSAGFFVGTDRTLRTKR